MFEDFRKSVAAALYERTASPLYGTFFISWCLWNWKIIYILFWVNNVANYAERMCYVAEYANWGTLVMYPLLSTLFFLTLGNLFANGAYWLQLRFDKWRRTEKEIMDGNARLTIEESISLRQEMFTLQENLQRTINAKDTEISVFKKQLAEVLEKRDTTGQNINEVISDFPNASKNENDLKLEIDFKKIIKQLSSIKEYEKYLDRIMDRTRSRSEVQSSDSSLYNYLPSSMLNILEANDIYYINEQKKGYYSDKGKRFIEYYINHKYGNEESSQDIAMIFQKIKGFEKYEQQLSSLMQYIQDGEKVNSYPSDRFWIDADLIALLEANEIIENIRGVGVYALTSKGKNFMKLYYDKKSFDDNTA